MSRPYKSVRLRSVLASKIASKKQKEAVFIDNAAPFLCVFEKQTPGLLPGA
jgi:hypothetical protein